MEEQKVRVLLVGSDQIVPRQVASGQSLETGQVRLEHLSVRLVRLAKLIERVEGGVYVYALIEWLEIDLQLLVIKDVV